MSDFNIAIIGAGPAGCSLAKLLIQANINVTVFEGEASPDVRSQGGTLDLHSGSGLAALRQAGLYDHFLKYARFDGAALKVTDKRFMSYLSVGGTKDGSRSGRPEIDRELLRKILYESLPPNIIKWGYHLRSIGDDLTLHFPQGDMSGYDLVIGADGAWSKVRPLLTDATPQHAGVGGFHFKISDPEKRFPDLYKTVNRGSIFSFSDHHSLMFQQMGDGSLTCSEWAVRDAGWERNQAFDIKDGDAVLAFLLQEYQDWSPEHIKFLEAADRESFLYRPLYLLPVGHTWEHRQGITLIGDAAHLTVPFAGEGVNVAMGDAMDLANAIISAAKKNSKTALTAEMKSFETKMFERARKVQERSIANMKDMLMTKGAPRISIQRYVTRAVQSQIGPFLGILVVVPVHVYYWLFKVLHRDSACDKDV